LKSVDIIREGELEPNPLYPLIRASSVDSSPTSAVMVGRTKGAKVMQGKRVVVTGGFGTLGRAVVARLGGQGAVAIAVDIAPVPAGWTGEAIGEVDISDPAEAQAVMVQLSSAGGLDGLVNVAGGFAWQTVLDGDLETWDRLYQINLRTALVMSRAAAPLLRKGGGAIVNIGAAGAAKAGAGMGAYAASKAGVARLTEALADELKDEGVRVNAILPSIIDTPANRADMPDADTSRWVSPEALANVVAFLLSDEASAVTGALVPVMGRV
jgi:NAD(P)-dependent dehydrogenase (short-subunit alcohol dehydrogenase family)